MGAVVLDFQYQLETVECANCCMTFAVAGQFIRDRRNDHKSFYCPSGHSNYFSGPSEAEKLKLELAQKERDLEWQRSRVSSLQRNKEYIENQLRATKGVVTKAKKQLARVENGVCPQCNRTFANVARHMQSKHGVECNQTPKGRLVRSQKAGG